MKHRTLRVLKLIASMLLLALLFTGASAAWAGEQARKAIAGVKELVASGQLPAGTALRFMSKGGSINNFWGHNFELKKEWESQTGIRIQAKVRPNQPVLHYMRDHKDFDLTMARVREYPDLYSEGLIVDLSPYMRKYGFSLDDNQNNGLFAPAIQTEFDSKVVATIADGDVAMLYLRQDLLEDKVQQARFQQRYGRPLSKPQTWQQYQQLVEFFHDPGKERYGSCENRDPVQGWMCWFPRYASQAAPNHYLFDDNMRPLLDTPQGIAATESYLQTIPYSPPQILEADHNITGPLYRDGHCFSYMSTMAMRKMFELSFSAVSGKVTTVLMPGTVVDNTLVRRTSFIFGNNLVVASSSPHPELAFLYGMWISDPDISTRSILVTSGQADPYRYNHLSDQRSWPIYSKEALEVLHEQVAIAIPPGTGLPGDHEYMKALNHNLNQAGRGQLTATQAMAKTAAQWEEITDRYGRARQRKFWQAFKAKFPQKTFPVQATRQ